MLLRRIAALSGLSLVVFSSGVIGVAAQQNKGQGGSGLSISPTRYERTISPGSTDTINDLTLSNVSGADVVAKSQINDFEPDGVTGEPKIITDPNKASGRSIKPFLTDVKDVPLKKDERKIFDVHIQVPKNAVPGAYYGVIRYTAVQADSASVKDRQVALDASVGTIVLITVPGNVNEQLQINSIHAFGGIKGYEKPGYIFIARKPTQVGLEVRNLGNGFAKPFGSVQVTDMFGKKVFAYEVNRQDPKANVLPDSNRTFRDDISNISTPGRYSVVAFISGTNGGQVISGKVSFWYLPVWFLAAIVIALVIVVLLCWIGYRKFIRPSTRTRR
ncbi:MAG: hypothetical protein NVS1B7_8090 [Candidatus Saccharimonadales bacterium]